MLNQHEDLIRKSALRRLILKHTENKRNIKRANKSKMSLCFLSACHAAQGRFHGTSGDWPGLPSYAHNNHTRAHVKPWRPPAGGRANRSGKHGLQFCFTNSRSGASRSLKSALTHFLKIETSSDNCSYFYGLIHLCIWSKLAISRQLFGIAKKIYPSSAPLICANLHDINIYTITVTILQRPKLSHSKGSIFKERNTLMATQL